MTKPARQLLASLGFVEPRQCYVDVTEAALLAAERRGMEKAVRALEGQGLMYAAQQVRVRKGEEE